MKRVRALFSGNVQGVGFRYTAMHIAVAYAVAGTVKNLPNGDVEIIAEGEEKELRDFIGAIRGRMSHYVDNVDEEWSEATGQFKGFVIAF
jgi:acylphosphatase